MPPLVLVVPIVLPIAASAIAALAGLWGRDIGRVAAAAGAWTSAIAIIAIWLAVRSTLDISLGQLGLGSSFDLRLDAVGVTFALAIAIPAAILLSLQPRTWQESSVASLAVAAAVLAVESGGVVITALAGCTAATLAVIQLDIEDLRAARPSWVLLLAAWLAVAWVGVILQVQSGTAVYSAVPVAAMTTPVFIVLAIAAVVASGMFPWRGWAARVLSRPSLRAGGITIATLQPLGLYLLVRAYEIGDGRYPQTGLNLVLAAWGVLVAFGAAARAQAASSRREYMTEVLPGLGGFALMSLAVGSALGLVAALILLASAAVVAACIPLLPDRHDAPSLLVTAAAAGLPPGLAFGGRLLGLDASFEAGGALGIIGMAGVATWLLATAAAARSVSLPAGRSRVAAGSSPRLGMVLGGLALAAGPALGVAAAMAAAAASDVMTVPSGLVGGGVASIVTVSTQLPAVALLGPLAIVGVVALLLSRPTPATGRAEARSPLFTLPGAGARVRLWTALRGAAVPEQYRSMVNPSALEAVAAGGTPVLWLATLVALGFAVTR
jgi:hypothetical protein